MKKKHKLVVRRDCGFFSDFLTILAGIMYFIDNEIDYHVDWKNSLYPTVNPNDNLFDLFFNQKIGDDENFDEIHYNITPYEYYFPEIVNLKSEEEIYNFLLKPSLVLKNHNIFNKDYLNKIDNNYFNNQKVLGVHRRATDHFAHGIISSDEIVLNAIEEELAKNKYDKIFLITDDLDFLNLMKNKFNEFLLFTESTKVTGNIGIHYRDDLNKFNLAEEVFKDAILLSKTDHKILTKSNVATFSNICNLQKNSFTYIDKNKIYQ
jgi:hypothetical protein